jgi:hypothetical protein
MNLSFHAEPKRGYVLFTVAGRADLPSAKRCLQRIVAECGRLRISKALIDLRGVKGRVSLADRYDYSVHGAHLHRKHETAYKKTLQVAYVGNDGLIDPGRFGELVARNRGAMVKATTEMSEGLAWLGVEPSPGSAGT